MKVQRLRFRYSLGVEATKLGQRELVEAWEQACKAASIPLAYSEGKRPSPLISVAAPLPQGVTSDCELLDMVLSERTAPAGVVSRIAGKLPPGLHPLTVEEVFVTGASLQSLVRSAEYEISVRRGEEEAVGEAICRMLAANTFPAQYEREKKVRSYDLRPLILDLRLDAATAIVRMRLRAEPERTARADQVASALGLSTERRMHRTRLVLEEVPPVMLAYRRLNSGDEA